MKAETVKPYVRRRYLLLALLLVLAVYVIVPQVGGFRSSWRLLSHPEPVWTAAAIGLTLSTYLSAALTYRLLAFRPLRYLPTVLVQLAAMFVNRLLPGGIGALGANYAYLRRQRHGRLQAGSLVAVNNLLGLVGHGLWLLILVLASSTAAVPKYEHLGGRLIIAAAVIALIVTGLALLWGWPKFKRRLAGLGRQLVAYRQRSWRLPLAVLSSMMLTIANILALAACALALGVHLPFVVIFLIFTLGLGAGTATPTPGGLGGFEAGLAAGLIAYDIPGATALAVALLYRLVSYWLPLVIGAIAFVFCERRNLFQASD